VTCAQLGDEVSSPKGRLNPNNSSSIRPREPANPQLLPSAPAVIDRNGHALHPQIRMKKTHGLGQPTGGPPSIAAKVQHRKHPQRWVRQPLASVT